MEFNNTIKRTRWASILLLITFFCFSQNSYGQYAADANVPDSTYLKTHSAHKATFYSAVLPGLGQIYNKKYWKVPIIYAGFAGLGYYAQYNNYVYKQYRDAYIARTDDDPETVDDFTYASEDNLLSQRDTWRRNRDLTYIVITLLYVAQIIDADVDAHLFDYDISEDLSMNVSPAILHYSQPMATKGTPPVGLRLSLRF